MDFFLNAVFYATHLDDSQGIELDVWRILRDTQASRWSVAIDIRWWERTLTALEAAEFFIDLLTPQSAESIYAGARREYALALNKPVIPLMLRPCPYPAVLDGIPYDDISDMPSYKLPALVMERASSIVPAAPPPSNIPRPPVPVLTSSSSALEIAEIFELADDALVNHQMPLAKYFLDQIRALNQPVYNARIRARLAERDDKMARSTGRRTARILKPEVVAAWQTLLDEYGIDARAPSVSTLTAQEHFERGQIRLKRENFDAAEADFTATIRLQPDFAEAYSMRGESYDTYGDIDRALSDFSEAIRLKPDFAQAWFNRASAGRITSERVADYGEAIRLMPESMTAFAAYANRGRLRTHDDAEGALADFAEALRLRPDALYVYLWRGDVYAWQKNDKARALENYETCLRLYPGFKVVLKRIANLNQE